MKAAQLAEKVLIDYIKIPDNIKFYIRAANYDLHDGPRGVREDDEHEWVGFTNACNIIRNWFRDNDIGNQLWVDMDCESVYDKEPEPTIDEETGSYIEPNWADIYLFEDKDIKRVVFGKELASYI